MILKSKNLAGYAFRHIASYFLFVPLSFGTYPQNGSVGDAPARASDAINSGKIAYAGICSACHGSGGEGGEGPSLADNEDLRSASDEDLFRIIHNGIPGTAMPAFPFPDQKIWQIVAFLRNLNSPAIDSNAPGDPRSGREIFFGKGGCSTCHMIRGKGGYPGPDLSNVGADRTMSALRQSLLKPDEHPEPGFQWVTAVTASGETLEGVAKSQSNYSVDILDAHGELHLFSLRDLQKITFHNRSLMPNDYGQRLTPAEIQNVLAFMSRQSTIQRRTR